MIPLEFQKFQITYLLLLIQHKQVMSQLNKQQFGIIIITAYGKSLRPNLCSKLSVQSGNSVFALFQFIRPLLKQKHLIICVFNLVMDQPSVCSEQLIWQ